MDELRLNKVFAGFLFAALLLMAGIKIADVLVPHQDLAENAYVIEVAETTEVASAAPVDAGPEPILALLAGADLGAGEKLSKKCSACHVFDAGGANKVGPALWNVIGRPRAASEGYAYSTALAEFGGQWDYQSMNAFLAKPKAYISGTKMNFAGLKKPQDRANLIAWMRDKADSPVALPSADDIAAEGAN
jgi:cytochrome c